MRIFAFDPLEYGDRYREQGWVHISGGIDPQFLAELQRVAADLDQVERLDSYAIKGKKEQALYEFPAGARYPEEIFDVVAAVCGLNRDSMTLSERHIQAYEPDANPHPTAHKDRFPSQVSVGFSIEIPEQSRLVLYPYDYRERNPFNRAAALNAHLQSHEHPDNALRDARAIEIADRPGDVVMFPGSTTWHLRRRSAGAINLYVKLNDFDCDPLGEDPATPRRREHTLQVLAASNGGQLAGHRVKLSRRFDSVNRRIAWNGCEEVLQASLYGEEPFGITESQLRILRAAEQVEPVERLVAALATNGQSRTEVLADVVRLLQLGALDVVP